MRVGARQALSWRSVVNALRQLSKDILRYGLGDIAVKAVGFLTLPLYTRVL